MRATGSAPTRRPDGGPGQRRRRHRRRLQRQHDRRVGRRRRQCDLGQLSAFGLSLFGTGATGNLVQGNFIGTDATGTVALGNGFGDGVEIDATYYGPSTDNTIGGTSANAGNLITDNGGPGVAVSWRHSSVGNQITANRIFGNTGQAIDLGDDGVTDNGTSPRQGPNNLQNFPIIVTTADGQTEGWLGAASRTRPSASTVFASAGYGPGGVGEAQDYLGSLEVTTDATGQATFARPLHGAGRAAGSSRPRPPIPRATPPKSRPFVERPCRRLLLPFARWPTNL